MSRQFYYFPIGVVLFLLVFLTRRYRRLRSVPGPWLASFTDLWRAYVQNRGQLDETLRRLHDKYGKVVRVGPNTVSIADGLAMPTIFTMHGEFKKADSYGTLRNYTNGQIRGTIIDIQDEGRISGLRRALGGTFTVKNVLDYEQDVEDALEALVKRLDQTPTVSLFEVLQQFQIDFLMKAAFSETPQHLQNQTDCSPLSFFVRFTHWGRWQALPYLEHLLYQTPLLYGFFVTPVKAVWATMGTDILEARSASKQSQARPDLLDKYMTANREHPNLLDREFLLRSVSSTISAGFDTTAFSMLTMLYYMLTNEHTFARLEEEINSATAAGQISEMPKWVEVNKLPYLDAVLKEAMRYHPFFFLPFERVVPPGGATISGTYLPEGTIVGCAANVVHRDVDVFGTDADVFRPERWIVDAEDFDEEETGAATKRLVMERAFLSFGSGKRICLGRHIAELEIKKGIPLLMRKYKISLEDPNAKLESINGVSPFTKPIIANFEER